MNRGKVYEDYRKAAFKREMCRIRLVCNRLSYGCADRQRIYFKAEITWRFCISWYAETAFFKIENNYYMIKGIEGNDYFRIAVHGKHEDELAKLEAFILNCVKE